MFVGVDGSPLKPCRGDIVGTSKPLHGAQLLCRVAMTDLIGAAKTMHV